MADLVKTTVTLPEEIFRLAKITALQEKTTLSKLIREALDQRLYKTGRTNKKPIEYLGKYTLGVKSKLHKQGIYDDFLKHKVSR